jgi:hypothetical protein
MNSPLTPLLFLSPFLIVQLGPDNLADLKKIYESFAASAGKGGVAAAGGDDDDVPDLVESNFEDVSKGEAKKA